MPVTILGFLKGLLSSAFRAITSPLGGLLASILVAVVSALLFFSVLHGKSVERALRATIATITGERDTARTERDTANQQLGQCRTERAQLEAQVNDQNNRIDQVVAEGRAVTEAARRETERQRKLAEDARRAANRVLNGRPAAGADLCLTAEAVLRGQEG